MPTRTLVHQYTPRGVARDLFFDRSPEVLLAGPAGTGKSRAALEKLHTMALLNPGMRGLIVRKTLSSLGSTGLVTFREKVAKESIVSGDVRWYGGSQQEAAAYRYSNGSTVVVGGMDKAIKIMSSEYDVIFVQEATELTEDDWEALTTRLRNGVVSFQQLIADCNPSTPTHWLIERVRRGATTMLESRHEDNPALFNDDGTLTLVGEAYIAKLDALTGVRYLRLRKGLWVAAEGLIYDGLDTAVHLITLDELHARFGWDADTRLCAAGLPWDWQRFWGIDFGFTNPFVLQRWAEDPDGRLYLYAEQYHTKKLVEDHVADLKKQVHRTDGDGNFVEWLEPPPRAILADHDAEDRATFHKHMGRGTSAANKKVKQGIEATQARFKKRGDGKPRIYFLRDAVYEIDQELVDAKRPTSTIDELPGYIWQPKANTAIAGGKPEPEEPVKKDDHGMDAMRYVVAHRDTGARPNIRVMGGR